MGRGHQTHTHTHTHRHSDIATTRPNQPSGPIRWQMGKNTQVKEFNLLKTNITSLKPFKRDLYDRFYFTKAAGSDRIDLCEIGLTVKILLLVCLVETVLLGKNSGQRLSNFTALYCTVVCALFTKCLRCLSAHFCTVLKLTALCWTVKQYSAQYCTVIHCTALHCSLLHCTAL